jgi:GDP-4-dehydro-6-deoxy-D-mannose reductase
MTATGKTLITGITGFVGKWLSEYLISKNLEVYGVDRWAQCPYDGVKYQQIDILNTSLLGKFLQRVQPDTIYHLAAISFLPEADLSPAHALEINIMGTVSILDALKQYCPSAKILLVGSSREYSDEINSEQVSEAIHPSPTNFYGISKYAAELIGQQYHRQYGLDIRCTRSFNHTGPAQSPRFVCSDWAKQVASIELGLTDATISVGDLDSVIDFTDVRDVVRAYYSILENGTSGRVYNVCSGKGVSLQWILRFLISKSTKEITINSDEKKLRLHKTNTIMLGDNSLLRNETGWKILVPFEKTLDDLYDYWLRCLQKQSSESH